MSQAESEDCGGREPSSKSHAVFAVRHTAEGGLVMAERKTWKLAREDRIANSCRFVCALHSDAPGRAGATYEEWVNVEGKDTRAAA